MLVLDSQDAQVRCGALRRDRDRRFRTVLFERHGRRPDGSRNAGRLHAGIRPAAEAPQGIGFFVCQQHYPENFWNPAFQRHPNRGDGRLGRRAGGARARSDSRRSWRPSRERRPTEPATHDLSFALPRGHLDVMTPDDAARSLWRRSRRIPGRRACVAFSVRIEDVERQSAMSDAAENPVSSGSAAGSIVPCKRRLRRRDRVRAASAET